MEMIPTPPPGASRATRVVAGFDRARLGVDRVLAAVCVVAFVLLVVIVTWQVWTRQVLDDPAPWTEEAARMTFVVLSLLGGALVFSERGHIAVELLVDRLPRTPKKVVAVLVQASVVFFALYVLVYGGYRAAQGAWGQNISTLPVSVGQVYVVLPVAGALIALSSLYHLTATLVGAEDPVPDVDENLQGI